jgi:hypothetical protein
MVTLLLQWCYNGVTVVLMLQRTRDPCDYRNCRSTPMVCYSVVTVVLQCSYSGVTMLLQLCYNGVIMVLQRTHDPCENRDCCSTPGVTALVTLLQRVHNGVTIVCYSGNQRVTMVLQR